MRAIALFVLFFVALGVACSSSTSTSSPDASACPGAQPTVGDTCTSVPDGTRCIYGDGCSASTVALECQAGSWSRGAFTARCDGGSD